MKFKNILAVAAHPDDLEFSCFGFLLKQQKNGSNIHAYVASPDSEEKNFFDKRIEETNDSFGLINNSNIFIRNKNKIFDNDYVEIADSIRQIILDNNIDLVLVHSKDDTHQEHRLMHDIVMTATRRLPLNILGYRSPSTENFNGKFIIDIKDEYDLKLSVT